MFSVKYDSTELVNSTYNLEYARDQSAPPRAFSIVPYSMDDGGMISFDRYGVKHIRVKGFITATTPAALQTALDTFKELFSRRDRSLDITPQGGTLRRYVANCLKHNLNANHYNNTFYPYEAEFIVVSGVGKPTSTTEVVNSILSSNYSVDNTLSVGSAQEQKLDYELTFTTASAIAGIKINTLNATAPNKYDTSIIVTKNPFVNTDALGIDADDKSVILNGSAVNYYGTFPRSILGTNNTKIEITFGQITIEQNLPGSVVGADIHGVNWVAQSFKVKHTDATYRTFKDMLIAATGTPPNDLVITIEGDSSGVPDGSAVATFTITAASLTGGGTYDFVTTDNAANFSLTGNTRYWIVFKTTAGDSSNKYSVRVSSTNTYSKGNWATSGDSGGAWTDDYDKDLWFKLLFGGKASGAFSIPTVIKYYPRYL